MEFEFWSFNGGGELEVEEDGMRGYEVEEEYMQIFPLSFSTSLLPSLSLSHTFILLLFIYSF